MTTKHERKRWKTKQGRRAIAAAQVPPSPPTPGELHGYAKELVAAGACSTSVLGSGPQYRTTDQQGTTR